MVKLSECKFGDRLRTRDGRLAIFMHKLPQTDEYCLAVAKTKERNDYFSAYYKKVSRKTGDFYECQYSSERYRGNGDIVGKWEDEK